MSHPIDIFCPMATKRTRADYNAYMRVYMLDRYNARMAEAKAFLGGKCVGCGATEPLEFDHIDPSQKSFTVSRWWSCAKKTFWAEVRKCALRCRSCHETRTSQQLGVDHGAGKSGKKNCRCEPCRARKKEYMRLWQQRHVEKSSAGSTAACAANF